MAVGRPQAAEDEHAREEILGDKYRILGVLGKGGIATTYFAEGPDGRQVALKQLHLWRRADWKVFELFEREARVLAQLSHPSIPRYVDSFRLETAQGPCFYLVQELVTGSTLKAWLESSNRATEDFVRSIARQLLTTLEYLHALRPPVIHRDIKPANLILRPDGTLALVDFGAVRDTDREQNEGSTIVGTFGFMAPEQFRGHAVPETDLYGVGATCAYLLSGKNPADLPHRENTPRLGASVSRPLRDWIERLLAPEPGGRFPSAIAARKALEAPGHQRPLRTRLFEPVEKPVKTVAGIAALAVAFVAIRLALETPAGKPAAAPATVAAESTVSTVSTGEIKWIRNYIGHWTALFDLAVDPSASRVVTASGDGTAKVWDLATGAALHNLTGHQSAKVDSLAITPDGANVLTGSDTIRVFDLATGTLLRAVVSPAPSVTALALSPDGTRFVSSSLDGTTRFWELASGAEQSRFDAKNQCFSNSWSPDGNRVAVGCRDGKIRILDPRTAGVVEVLAAHTSAVDALVYSPDGKTLFSSSDDHTIRIWTPGKTEPLATLTGHTDEVWALSVSPDGKTLLSGSKDKTIRVWDVYGARQRDVFRVAPILKVRFLADGQRFLVAQSNGVAALFTIGKASWEPPLVTSPVAHVPRPVPPGAAEDVRRCIEAEQLLDDGPASKPYLERARVLLGQALAENPRSALAHALLARVAYREGYKQRDEYDPKSLLHAHEELDKAEALDPNLVVLHIVRAYTYVFQKDIAKARESEARAVAVDPKDPRVLLLRAFVAQEAKAPDEAFEISRTLVETTRDPAYLATAYSRLIEVYKRRSDPNAAEAVHRSLVNLDPDNPWAKGNLASFLVWRGKYDDAIEWARQALAQMDYGNAHHVLADAFAGKAIALLKAKGPTPEVDALVTEAERASSNSADACYARGLLHRALGNGVRATLAFKAALALEPEHAGAKAALASQ